MRLHPLSIITGIFAMLRQFLGFIVVAVALALMGERERSSPIDLLFWFVFPVVLSIVASGISYLSTHFQLTPEAAILDTGIIWKRRRMVPRARVQEVHLTQNFIQRVLGIVEVKIEGTGSTGSEITLSGVGQEDAESIRAQLTGSHPAFVYQRPEPPEYSLSVGRIVWASLLENRALLVVVGLVGVMMPFLENDRARSRLVDLLFKASSQIDPRGWAVLLVSILVVGWIASVAMGLWQFYGFEIKKHPKGLQITHGLVNLVTRVISVRRVQQVIVAQGLLYRIFRLHSVRVKAAGVEVSEKVVSGQGFLSPAATDREVPDLVRLVFPEADEADVAEWRPLSRLAPWIGAVGTLLSVAFLPHVAWFLANHIDAAIEGTLRSRLPALFDERFWYVSGGLALLAALVSFGRTRTIRYRQAGGLLQWRRGQVSRLSLTSPVSRLQFVEVSQSPLDRWFRTASTTCAFPGTEISIEILPTEAATELRDRCLDVRSQHPGRGV